MTSIADVSDRSIAELVSLAGRTAVVTGLRGDRLGRRAGVARAGGVGGATGRQSDRGGTGAFFIGAVSDWIGGTRGIAWGIALAMA